MSRTSDLLVAVLVALVGCVEPTQYGGPIPVDHAGMQARLEALCGLGRVKAACAPAPAETESDGNGR